MVACAVGDPGAVVEAVLVATTVARCAQVDWLAVRLIADVAIMTAAMRLTRAIVGADLIASAIDRGTIIDRGACRAGRRVARVAVAA